MLLGTGVAAVEVAHARLMRFDGDRIPIVRHGCAHTFGTGIVPSASVRLFVDGEQVTHEALSADVGVTFQPAKGWVGHIELGDG